MLNNKTKTVQNIEIHGNDVVIINGLRINQRFIANLSETLCSGREIMTSTVLHLMTHAIKEPVNFEFLMDENFPYHFHLTMESLKELEFINPKTKEE